MSDARPPGDRWSRFEHDLLRSAKRDAPSRGARRRAFIALAAGSGATVGSTTAGVSTAAGVTGATASTSGAAAKLALITFGKWLGLGLLGVGGLLTADYLGHAPSGVDANAPTVTEPGAKARGAAPRRSSTNVTETARQELTSASAAITDAGPKVDPQAGSPATSEASANLKPRPAASPPPTQEINGAGSSTGVAYPRGVAEDPPAVASSKDSEPLVEPSAEAMESPPRPILNVATLDGSLARETSSLEAVRAALRRNQPGLALRALDDYKRSFAHGALEPESVVLRIEVKLAQGDRADAAALGKRFLEAFPDSPHAWRVRTLLGL